VRGRGTGRGWRRLSQEGRTSPDFPANGTSSTLGEALVSYIQRELAARTGMLDCGTYPKTWELLRMTQMPAVRVELGT
jgi:N-acetylmuramoyl-L-alanine amidase